MVLLGGVHGHRRLVGEDAQHRQVCRLGVALEPVQPHQTAHDVSVEGHRHPHPTAPIDHLACARPGPQSPELAPHFGGQQVVIVDELSTGPDGEVPRPGGDQRAIGEPKQQPLRLEVLTGGPHHLLDQAPGPFHGPHEGAGDGVHGAHRALHPLVGATVFAVVGLFGGADAGECGQIRRSGPAHRGGGFWVRVGDHSAARKSASTSRRSADLGLVDRHASPRVLMAR